MAWNSFFTPVDMVGPVLTRWTRFWPKMTVLTRNRLKLIFYPGRHGLTRIDSVDSVLTENSFFTLVDMFWPVLTRWTRFWPKMTVLTRNGPKLIFYPGRHGLTRIDLVDSVLVKNNSLDPKRPETHFLPWSTWFDPYWPGRFSFDGKMRLTREKYIFAFFLFLNFFGFL